MSRVLSKQTREAARSTHGLARTPSHWVMRPFPPVASSCHDWCPRVWFGCMKGFSFMSLRRMEWLLLQEKRGGSLAKMGLTPSPPPSLSVAQPGRCFVSLHGGCHSFLYQRWTGLFFLDEVSDRLPGVCVGPFSFVPVSGSIHLAASLLFLSVQ